MGYFKSSAEHGREIGLVGLLEQDCIPRACLNPPVSLQHSFIHLHALLSTYLLNP